MDDSLPYIAFKIARASAYVAAVPGVCFAWLGFNARYRAMRLAVGGLLTFLGACCLLAVVSNSGNQDDGWDTLGAFYWSGIAAGVLLICAMAGNLIGRMRHRAEPPNLSE